MIANKAKEELFKAACLSYTHHDYYVGGFRIGSASIFLNWHLMKEKLIY